MLNSCVVYSWSTLEDSYWFAANAYLILDEPENAASELKMAFKLQGRRKEKVQRLLNELEKESD